MSGAEIVGLAAAATQFADIGWRVFLGLSKICSDLRHAPQSVRDATLQVQQTVEVIELLRSETSTTAFPSTRSQASIAALIKDALSQAIGLEALLDGLTSQAGEQRAKRAWRSVVTVKKEDEIGQRCQKLDAIKNTITVWIGQENLSLLRQQQYVTHSMFQKSSVHMLALGKRYLL